MKSSDELSRENVNDSPAVVLLSRALAEVRKEVLELNEALAKEQAHNLALQGTVDMLNSKLEKATWK